MNWLQRLHYKMDEFFARGAFYLIFVPGLAAFLGLLVVVSVVFLFHAQPEGVSWGKLLWMAVLRMLDPGTMSGDEGSFGFVAGMFTVTLMGIFLVSLLIGVVGAWLETHLNNLRKGRSFVPESNHILILGWSPQIFLILHELIAAGPERHQTVVVLAYQDKVAMDDRIRDRVLNKYHCPRLRVVCRHGNPMDPHDLERVNPGEARSVIILPDKDFESETPDIYVVKVIMALARTAHKRLPIIAPVMELESAELLRELKSDHDIYPVVVRDVIARITAQTALQSGLSYIYEDLLNFEGDEIYYSRAKREDLVTWRDVALSYETATALGLRRGAKIVLNPGHRDSVLPDDEIIAVAANLEAIQPDGALAPLIRSEFFALRAEKEPPRPRKVLLLGWNRGAPFLLRYMLEYLPEGSTILVVTSARVDAKERLKILREIGRDRVTFREDNAARRQVLDDLHPEAYDHVVVLSEDTADIQHADARTLMILLHLRDILNSDDTPFTLVSEMRDMQNRLLAEIANVDDFIISDHIASLMMTQLACNPDLWGLYDELFAPEGAEIYLKPIEDYVQTGVPVNFYTLTASALHYHEMALGYRIAADANDPQKNFGIRLNPRKSAPVTFQPGDMLIVLAES